MELSDKAIVIFFTASILYTILSMISGVTLGNFDFIGSLWGIFWIVAYAVTALFVYKKKLLGWILASAYFLQTFIPFSFDALFGRPYTTGGLISMIILWMITIIHLLLLTYCVYRALKLGRAIKFKKFWTWSNIITLSLNFVLVTTMMPIIRSLSSQGGFFMPSRLLIISYLSLFAFLGALYAWQKGKI
jgi:hypothetical protein